jgi:hypothetical protein
MPPSLLVHALELSVTQKPRAAGKRARTASRLRISFRFSRLTGSHSDSKFPDRCFQVTNAPGCRKMSGIAAGGRGFSRRAAGLFAETWFYRDPLAPLGASAGKYFLAALGLHAHAKSVCLRSLAPVGLECTLGQSSSLLIPSTVLGQTVSINHLQPYVQTAICKLTVQFVSHNHQDTESREGSSHD